MRLQLAHRDELKVGSLLAQLTAWHRRAKKEGQDLLDGALEGCEPDPALECPKVVRCQPPQLTSVRCAARAFHAARACPLPAVTAKCACLPHAAPCATRPCCAQETKDHVAYVDILEQLRQLADLQAPLSVLDLDTVVSKLAPLYIPGLVLDLCCTA